MMNKQNQQTIKDFAEKHGKDGFHQLALLSGFKEKVPFIDDFISDPYYLGNSIGDGIYPIWQEASSQIFPTPYYSPWDEIILSGAIGLGKSTQAMIILMYDICKMLSLKNPHHYYDLLDSTPITFALMNSTHLLSKNVLFYQILNWIENSPYFKSKLIYSKKDLRFVNNIAIIMGSRGNDMLGQATAGAIFSEINDMTIVGGQAKDAFDTISTRRQSRFGGKDREIIGHLILDSSNKGERSFIEGRLKDKDAAGTSDYKVFSYAHWEAKWHLGGYSDKWFDVYAGDEHLDPFIIEDDSDIGNFLDPTRILKVPVEHYDEYKFDIIKSLRDLSGVSTFGSTAYLASNVIVNEVFSGYNCVSKNKVVLDFDDDNQKLIDLFDIELLNKMSKAERFIHIDLGIKVDSTGIACSYLDKFEDNIEVDSFTGEKTNKREAIFKTEWVLEIRPSPGKEVPIFKIQNLIQDMIARKYPVGIVSTDGYQSKNLRQNLEHQGVKTEEISVDRTKDPYLFMRNIILEKRLTAPNVEHLKTEILGLEESEKKIDHPIDGTKDVADAICGSLFSCNSFTQTHRTTLSNDDLMESLVKMQKNRNTNPTQRIHQNLTDSLHVW